MAAGELIATGRYRSVLDSDGSYLESKISGRKIPLELSGNTFWLPALVAPIDEGDVADCPAPPTSSVADCPDPQHLREQQMTQHLQQA